MQSNVALTVNDEMVLPWQFQMEGCHDFQLCARQHKAYECDTYTRQQEYHNFMKGRPFRIMFVKNGIWLKGKVSQWIEYYMDMGLADTTVTWILVADFEAASSVSVGAFVREKGKHDDKMDVDGDQDTNKRNGFLVTALNPDEETCQLVSFTNKSKMERQKASIETFDASQFALTIHRVNVQGGGTISAKRTFDSANMPNNLISFEWTAPFLDESYHLLAPDAFPVATSSTTEYDELLRRKADMIEQLRSAVLHVSTSQEKMNACAQLYSHGLQTNIGDAEELRKELLCLPFVLYGLFLRSLIKGGALSCDNLGSAMTIVAMALNQAEDAKKNAQEFAFLTKIVAEFYSVPKSATPSELTEQVFCLSLYGVLSPIGEWFEFKQEDYRTAIWCYDKAQEVVHRAPFPLGGADTQGTIIFTDTLNTGVAYRRMGDFLSAAKYYEKAFAQPPPTTRNRADLITNARNMQGMAPDWVGTSGYFTPWETEQVKNGPVGDCASCGTAGARRKCGSCRVVYYCNATCQNAHWRSAHQYTCVFKKVTHL